MPKLDVERFVPEDLVSKNSEIISLTTDNIHSVAEKLESMLRRRNLTIVKYSITGIEPPEVESNCWLDYHHGINVSVYESGYGGISINADKWGLWMGVGTENDDDPWGSTRVWFGDDEVRSFARGQGNVLYGWIIKPQAKW